MRVMKGGYCPHCKRGPVTVYWYPRNVFVLWACASCKRKLDAQYKRKHKRK